MTEREQPELMIQRNPFPDTPEVTLGRSGDMPKVTVDTASIEDARNFIEDYVRVDGGNSLFVIGDYGSGKSHLVSQAIDRLRDRNLKSIICAISVNDGDTFCTLYSRVFNPYNLSGADDNIGTGLRRADLKSLVENVFNEMAREHWAQIQSSARWEPSDAVSLSWPGGNALADDIELTRALQRRLTEITHDREYADALSLLLHNDEEIGNQAWAWLHGDPVTPDIAKRGVENPIQDETRALAALMALARLLNAGKPRFALVLDDFQRLGGGSGSLSALVSHLIRWAAESRSLLIVSALASWWQTLPEGVRQRAGRIIYPSPLTKADIASYQREIYRWRDIRKDEGVEFTSGAFALMHDITRGSPRRVVKTCYTSYNLVRGKGRVEPAVVEQATRDIAGSPSDEEMYQQIYEFCGRHHHPVSSGHRIGDVKAPLWIPAASGESGCVIVVTGSLLNSADAGELLRLGTALAGPANGSSRPGVILVRTGQLAASLEPGIRAVFPNIIRWEQDEFWGDLDALITKLSGSLEAKAESDVLRGLSADIGSLRSYRAEDHAILRQLADAQDEGHLRRLIREEAHRAYLRSSGDKELLDFGELAALQRVFDDAVSTLRDSLARVEQLWQSMFQSANPERLIDRSQAPGGRPALPTDLTPGPIVRSVGVLVALDYALDGFGRAIIGLVHQEQAEGKPVRRALYQQCVRFDQTAEELVSLIPASDEDSSYVVLRVLGVDRGAVLAKVLRLGSAVYDLIYSADFTR